MMRDAPGGRFRQVEERYTGELFSPSTADLDPGPAEALMVEGQ